MAQARERLVRLATDRAAVAAALFGLLCGLGNLGQQRLDALPVEFVLARALRRILEVAAVRQVDVGQGHALSVPLRVRLGEPRISGLDCGSRVFREFLDEIFNRL